MEHTSPKSPAPARPEPERSPRRRDAPPPPPAPAAAPSHDRPKEQLHPSTKRARSRSPPREDDSVPRKIPHVAGADDARQMASLVAAHYNERPAGSVVAREDSPIFQMRCFNNWVKAVLMQQFLRRGDSVLDMGCGKGGDLQKYRQANIRELYGFDVANVSIEEARRRFSTIKGARFNATFTTLDCYNDSIEPHIPRDVRFNAVSMQFCMHYAFRSERQVRQMLENISSRLVPGGYFFGTTTDANVLVKKLRAAEGLEFGNSICTVRFAQRDTYPVYGHEYHFKLVDAIDDCPEYLVHWPSFTKLAREYGLEVMDRTNFHAFFQRNADRFRDLLVRMKVLTTAKPSVSPDEWEAIGLYMAFAFRKV
ncbi:mRNA cap guanine-N7 methyltransferase [Blastocladiella emersonii ATCC 22665]|nr:mRNA cap guanine-N7 methyltransferase [Blastocladiella emersonii ATCC 22665]